MISLPLAFVSSDKEWWSLSPGTLVLLVGPIGLMVIQATKFDKNKVCLTGNHQLSLINEPNISLQVLGINFLIDPM